MSEENGRKASLTPGGFLTICNTKRKMRAQRLTLIFCVCAMSLMLMGMGEKYSEQGGRLGKRIHALLITEGYCAKNNNLNCKDVLFGEDGNRVNLHLYGVHDRKVIASVLSVVAAEGMEITGGVPITIRFFSKPKKELLWLKSFTASPAIIMEVNE